MTIADRIQATVGHPGPIGVFDSGYGGLTILRELRRALPHADFIYLGDNARAPYGSRSFELIYRFTLEAVRYLFARGCQLVIIACNTASAKALRTIQQCDLPAMDPARRVLGVIRPTAEMVGNLSRTGRVALVATPGTVASRSYDMELAKLYPQLRLYSKACPMWVPLVENRESESPGADYFIRRDIAAVLGHDRDIDTLILGCTHYPILIDKIRRFTPRDVRIVQQGHLVADSLVDYLQRHAEIDAMITRGGTCTYLTTEDPDKFRSLAEVFMGTGIDACQVALDR